MKLKTRLNLRRTIDLEPLFRVCRLLRPCTIRSWLWTGPTSKISSEKMTGMMPILVAGMPCIGCRKIGAINENASLRIIDFSRGDGYRIQPWKLHRGNGYCADPMCLWCCPDSRQCRNIFMQRGNAAPLSVDVSCTDRGVSL